jgi:hypothetical protein
MLLTRTPRVPILRGARTGGSCAHRCARVYRDREVLTGYSERTRRVRTRYCAERRARETPSDTYRSLCGTLRAVHMGRPCLAGVLSCLAARAATRWPPRHSLAHTGVPPLSCGPVGYSQRTGRPCLAGECERARWHCAIRSVPCSIGRRAISRAHAGFAYGDSGSNTCPPGTWKIVTAAACQGAAAAVGTPYYGTTARADQPSGCFNHGGTIWFNTDPTGGGVWGILPLCAGAPPGLHACACACVWVYVCVSTCACLRA